VQARQSGLTLISYHPGQGIGLELSSALISGPNRAQGQCVWCSVGWEKFIVGKMQWLNCIWEKLICEKLLALFSKHHFFEEFSYGN